MLYLTLQYSPTHRSGQESVSPNRAELPGFWGVDPEVRITVARTILDPDRSCSSIWW